MVEKEGVSEGKRNATGFQLTMYYRRQGINNPQELLNKIKDWNTKNNPPLEESELTSIISSAMKYEVKQTIKENKKENGDEENVIRTSSIIIDDVMYEQGYDTDTQKTYFIKEGNTEITNAQGKTIHVQHHQIEHNGIIYKPLIGDELKKNVVLLPTHAHFYLDIQDLIDKIKTHIHKYSDVTSDFEELASYYVLLTYVYDQFNEIPYLSFQGDTGTGKSRAKNTIGMICYKPMLNNGGASSAAMYRITEKWKGTMIMDEADIKDSDEQNDVIKYLNCGFEKNSPIMKCDKLDPNKIQFFDPFCPKIVARRQNWDDKATESRCITEITKTTSRRDIPFKLNNGFYKDCLVLRNRLLSFRLNNWKVYRDANSDFSDFFKDLNIEPRLQQTLGSIISLLVPFPDALVRIKVFLQRKQKEVIEERAISLDGEIINAIYELIEVQKKCWIIAKDIADIINYNNGEVSGGRDFLKPRKVSGRLKSLGIKIGKLERSGKDVFRKIEIDSGKMTELYKKYVIDYKEKCNDVTIVTIYKEMGEIVTNKEKQRNVTVEGVSNSIVTTVTTVTNDETTKKIQDFGIMQEFLQKNDFENNDVPLFEKFSTQLIDSSIKTGLVFQHKPNWYKLT